MDTDMDTDKLLRVHLDMPPSNGEEASYSKGAPKARYLRDIERLEANVSGHRSVAFRFRVGETNVLLALNADYRMPGANALEGPAPDYSFVLRFDRHDMDAFQLIRTTAGDLVDRMVYEILTSSCETCVDFWSDKTVWLPGSDGERRVDVPTGDGGLVRARGERWRVPVRLESRVH